MKAPDKKSGKSTTSTAAPPARAASFTSEAQAEGAVEKAPDKKSDESTSTAAPPAEAQAEGAVVKAPDKKSGESTSTAAPPAHAASFTVEAQTEGAVEKAPDKKSDESTSTAAPPKRMRQLLPVRLRSNWVGTVRPDKFAYSEADWQKIKASLARVGIDADAVTVPDRWWAHPDPAAALVAEPQLIGKKIQGVILVKRPLREQLQELAGDYLGLAEFIKQGKALTPRQEAAEIREALNKFARPLAAALALDNSLTFSFSPHREDVSKALAPFIAHAQRFHDRLMAEGSYNRFNAYKAHIEYWGKLVLWWRTRTPGRRQRKEALSQFLLACTKPAFSEQMLQSSSSSSRLPTIESRIASFLNKAT